jgi:Holliday junction resolvase RusA-like endonuclease
VITIEVRGLPAPQGSKRHVGRGIMVESSKAVGPWREAVRAETQRVMKEQSNGPLEGALYVGLYFTLQRPKSHYRTGRNAHLLRDSAPAYPAGRPDGDKLERAVWDGLTSGGAYADDGQVVMWGGSKAWGTPGCVIEIERLEEG